MKNTNIGAVEFENRNYHDDWAETVPVTGRPYRLGTYVRRGDGFFTVYDGAENYMGDVSPTGELACNGSPDVYKGSFLWAVAELVEEAPDEG